MKKNVLKFCVKLIFHDRFRQTYFLETERLKAALVHASFSPILWGYLVTEHRRSQWITRLGHCAITKLSHSSLSSRVKQKRLQRMAMLWPLISETNAINASVKNNMVSKSFTLHTKSYCANVLRKKKSLKDVHRGDTLRSSWLLPSAISFYTAHPLYMRVYTSWQHLQAIICAHP